MASLWTITQAGTNSYPTGGFVITTSLATLDAFAVTVGVYAANLPSACFDVALNAPGAGQATVKVMRRTYDKLTALGSPTGLPSGVSLAATSGQSYDANTAHTHSIDHDHGAVTSGAVQSGSGAANTTLGSGNYSTHTHTFDVPGFSGTSGTTTHTHTNSNIYQHQQVLTNTTTDLAPTELANATDLSGITFTFLGVDA